MAGMLVDAFGARRTVTVFLVIAGTGQVLFALAPSFSMALLGRALSGLGAATLYVGASIALIGWRFSLGTVGVAVLVTALLVYVFVRDTPAELKLPAPAEVDDRVQHPGGPPLSTWHYLRDSYGHTQQQAANMLSYGPWVSLPGARSGVSWPRIS
jgi:predicted MFS family arabinose efflux permease